LREAGAVVLGKLGTHEFAFGATGMNPHYGNVRNPYDPERMTGGSSSGSAAAVASGMCYAALGSDTGGSIRCPAALCGIVGLKPTYDLLPRDGVVPLSWSLDHVGPMTRTVADAALMLKGMGGNGAPGTSDGDVVNSLRIGLPEEWFWDATQPGVSTAVAGALRALAGAGARVQSLSLPSLQYAHAAQNVILCAEATTYHRPYLRTRADEYGASVRSRLLPGLFTSAADYLDAQRARREVRREFLAALENVDVLVTPAVPIVAPRFDEAVVQAGDYEGPPQAFLVRNTFPFNLVGLPAISLPCGRSEGMPVGLQIAAAPRAEAKLLHVAAAAEALLGSA
jgi:aspartyl-tRNA(Asn)/glutamyl-tRNA(Gln) amidotransferase subunit A